jgi:hypothetical protein
MRAECSAGLMKKGRSLQSWGGSCSLRPISMMTASSAVALDLVTFMATQLQATSDRSSPFVPISFLATFSCDDCVSSVFPYSSAVSYGTLSSYPTGRTRHSIDSLLS